MDVGPGTYTAWTEVTALLAPDVAPVDRHKVRPINCHDQDPGGPPTYPATFADPWPGCGHRLLASPFRNSSNEHACTPPHLCLAHIFFFFLSSPALCCWCVSCSRVWMALLSSHCFQFPEACLALPASLPCHFYDSLPHAHTGHRSPAGEAGLVLCPVAAVQP